VEFLYSAEGQRIFTAHGLLPVPILVGGDPGTVPPSLRHLIRGTYEG